MPRGRTAPPARFSLACFRDIPQGKLPWNAPRETDSAARHPKGDGFRPVSVSLTGFRDVSEGRLPRGCPRGTLLAARLSEGEGPRPIFSPSRTPVTSRRSSQPHAKGPPRKAGLQHKTMFACSSLQAQRVNRARRNASAALDALVLVDLSVVVDGQSAYRAGICASAARDAGILVNLYCHESSLLYTAPRGAVFSVAEKLLALYRPTLELVTDNIPKAPETPPSGHTIIWPTAA